MLELDGAQRFAGPPHLSLILVLLVATLCPSAAEHLRDLILAKSGTQRLEPTDRHSNEVGEPIDRLSELEKVT